MNDSSLLAVSAKKIKATRKVIHFKSLKDDQIRMLCLLLKLKKYGSAVRDEL
jgi:hypothetical protein